MFALSRSRLTGKFPTNILVVGATGFFGDLLCRSMISVFRNENFCLSVSGLDHDDLTESVHNLRNFTAVKRGKMSIQPVDINIQKKTEQEMLTLFKQIKVSLVVNLAGPFFSTSPLVPSGMLAHHEKLIAACVKSNVHYIDIAESSDHIRDLLSKSDAMFATENDEPRSTSVVITGASTVPALSTACAADAFEAINSASGNGAVSIEVFLSPGNKVKQQKFGFAAVSSLFLRLGRSFSTIRGGSEMTQFNWTNIRRSNFLPPVGPRLGCEVESPDVIPLLQQKSTVVGNYSFHAGLERTTLSIIMGLLGTLACKAPSLAQVFQHRYFSVAMWRFSNIFRRFLGTPNGSFMVRVERNGFGSGVTFIAQRGDGVYLPIIPVLHVIEKLFVSQSTSLPRSGGVFVCASSIDRHHQQTLRRGEEYAPTVAETMKLTGDLGLSIAAFIIPSVVAISLDLPVFKTLHPTLQAFHSRQSPRNFASGALEPVVIAGMFTAAPVKNPLMRLVGAVIGVPQGVQSPCNFTLHRTITPLEERWDRTFSSPSGMSRMTSMLRVAPRLDEKLGFYLEESFLWGLLKCQFDMKAVEACKANISEDHPAKNQARGQCIVFDFARMVVAGVALPRFLVPRIEAVEFCAAVDDETGKESLVCFDVKVVAPLGMGLVCHYKGSAAVASC